MTSSDNGLSYPHNTMKIRVKWIYFFHVVSRESEHLSLVNDLFVSAHILRNDIL